MTLVHCPYCGHEVQLIFVHSHYQCPVCGANIMPCCEGEQASETGDTPVPPNNSCNISTAENRDKTENKTEEDPD